MISVVIATRDRRELLAEAVESVRRQTSGDWELLVVDDASRDGTREWLANPGDGRVRSFRLDEHSERSVARNRGLAAARGEFIMFLDDDDRLRPEALAYLVEPLRRDARAVAAVGARLKFRDGVYATRINHPVRRSKRVIWPALKTTSRDILPELLAGWGWSAVSGQTLYRTDAVRRAGGYPPRVVVVEDRALWLRVARLGAVVVLPDIVLEYRDHGGQWRPANLFEMRREVFAAFIAELPQEERRRARRARAGGEALYRADAEFARAHYAAALSCYLKSCVIAPELFFSPLTAPAIMRAAASSLARVLRPRAAAGEKISGS
ncbi:MAG TPA: glycosyltransferase family 2 protein [Pyrinomonadaceae bacterium]|nr:glycosyltransferase family 2 protein [Pyrinomonadaceae bacterium]